MGVAELLIPLPALFGPPFIENLIGSYCYRQ